MEPPPMGEKQMTRRGNTGNNGERRRIIRGTALLFAVPYVVSVSEQHLENVQRKGGLPSHSND
jgi:hypothetical protein